MSPDRHPPRQSLTGLAAFLALCAAVAAIGAQFEPGPWYDTLDKPGWNPPDWAFPVAWSLLYLLMAVAGWRVWRRHGFAGAGPALTLFLLQLALNAAWSWLFFGLRRIDLALIDACTLWLAILATAWLFWRHDRPAGVLMLPYLAWVGFAVALNATLWRLNG